MCGGGGGVSFRALANPAIRETFLQKTKNFNNAARSWGPIVGTQNFLRLRLTPTPEGVGGGDAPASLWQGVVLEGALGSSSRSQEGVPGPRSASARKPGQLPLTSPSAPHSTGRAHASSPPRADLPGLTVAARGVPLGGAVRCSCGPAPRARPCLGECLPGACPACYLCIKYLISSPRFILTLESPSSRPH